MNTDASTSLESAIWLARISSWGLPVTENDGNLYLQIDQRTMQLNLDDHGPIHGVGNWGISGAGPRKFKVQENNSEHEVCPTEGRLEFEVKMSGKGVSSSRWCTFRLYLSVAKSQCYGFISIIPSYVTFILVTYIHY